MRRGRPPASGLPGVHTRRKGGYGAAVTVNGRTVELGRYDSPGEAAFAAEVAAECLARGEWPLEDTDAD